MMNRDRMYYMKNSYMWVIYIVMFVFLYMLLSWNLDISVSAIVNGGIDPAFIPVLTNGFWETSPTQMYHVSLWGTNILFMFAIFWVLRERVTNDARARERIMRELGISKEAR